jgi:NSS family neurotransmitter:Na+ symporter
MGSSIGLGNVWKFPYELGIHGGTFLYVYITCVLLVAFPLMIAELLIGRVGQGNPVNSIRAILKDEKKSPIWEVIGWLGILSSFLIFSFYSVVASWTLFYIMQSLSGAFVEVPAEIVQNSFGALLRNADQQIIWYSVYVLMVVLVLSRGVRSGLERAVRILMPLFIGFVIWLAIYASEVGDFQSAYAFMTHFDINDMSPELLVSALTQALFSLSIGIGILIMYGSYLGEARPLFLGAGTIMIFDTGIALLMGFIILSIVFAFGMDHDTGAGLIFETLPVAFSQIAENGIWWSSSFFFLLFVAALTSGFALLEPSIALISSRWSISRRYAAWVVGASAWGLGWVSIYSFSEPTFSFYYFGEERLRGYFDLFNIVTTHVLLPLTALLIALFAGWKMSKNSAKEALAIRPVLAYRLWRFCIRYVAPVIITAAIILVLFIPA